MTKDVAKRVVEVYGPQHGAQVIRLADALMRQDAAIIAAFAPGGESFGDSLSQRKAAEALGVDETKVRRDVRQSAADEAIDVAGPRPSVAGERVVEVDLSVADANGKLKDFGGAESDRANALLIGKTASAVSANDEITLAAMREMKPRDFFEGMALSLAAANYAAAMDGFALAKDARPLARGEHLLHATRCSMTALSLIDAVRRLRSGEPTVANGSNPVNAGPSQFAIREGHNAYQRDLMRRRRALAKARQIEGRPQ
jgi:hypothetical protein